MDLIDRLRAIGSRAQQTAGKLETEEATKMALVVPFIEALGYQTWNPDDVVPEFNSDIMVKKEGKSMMKKGEKVDYAIMSAGKPIMLFECKRVGTKLEDLPLGQLQRYFHVSSARVGVVTDGIHYRIFSDLRSSNKMDSHPFLEFDIRAIDDHMAAEIKQFAKESFDIDKMLVAAEEMKYTKAIMKKMSEQFTDPSEELVRFYTKEVYDGSFTQVIKEKFTPIVQRASRAFVDERIAQRLNAAAASRGASSIGTRGLGRYGDGAARRGRRNRW